MKYRAALKGNKGRARTWHDVHVILLRGEKSKFGNHRKSIFVEKKSPKEYLSVTILPGLLHVMKAYHGAWMWEQATPTSILKTAPHPLHIPDPLTLFCIAFFHST